MTCLGHFCPVFRNLTHWGRQPDYVCTNKLLLLPGNIADRNNRMAEALITRLTSWQLLPLPGNITTHGQENCTPGLAESRCPFQVTSQPSIPWEEPVTTAGRCPFQVGSHAAVLPVQPDFLQGVPPTAARTPVQTENSPVAVAPAQAKNPAFPGLTGPRGPRRPRVTAPGPRTPPGRTGKGTEKTKRTTRVTGLTHCR